MIIIKGSNHVISISLGMVQYSKLPQFIWTFKRVEGCFIGNLLARNLSLSLYLYLTHVTLKIRVSVTIMDNYNYLIQ
uniref:Uncharacterized protein n=1 Tax=Octopus bimaculoides TaxID=37653 RepID=A0A0L8G837_OCTBM